MPFVHFNSHEHRKNKKDGGNRKTLVYRKTKTSKPIRCRDIRFTNANGSFVYNLLKPLKCGAVSWVEFDEGSIIVLVDPDLIQDSKGKNANAAVLSES